MTKKEYFFEETAKHIRNVQVVMDLMVQDLLYRQRNHDVTKYTNDEADLFAEVSPELSKSEYGSDDYKSNLQKIRPAIEHHNRLNNHHPEHYPNGIKDMDLLDLLEMVADWMAASRRNPNGHIRKSIEQNQKRFGYSDEFKNMLLKTARQFESAYLIMEEHYKYAGK